MKKYQENGAVIVLVTAAACILFMFSGGIRTNFGIIVQTLSDRTGVSYADVSFAIAVGQLVYGVSQPFFGILALKRSNGFVLSLGTILMAAGLLLTAQVSSAPALVVTLGLLFSAGTGATCFGIIMAAITPVLGQRRASAVSGILNASSGSGLKASASYSGSHTWAIRSAPSSAHGWEAYLSRTAEPIRRSG